MDREGCIYLERVATGNLWAKLWVGSAAADLRSRCLERRANQNGGVFHFATQSLVQCALLCRLIERLTSELNPP